MTNSNTPDSSLASTSSSCIILTPFVESFQTRQSKWNQVQRLFLKASSVSCDTPITNDDARREPSSLSSTVLGEEDVIRPLSLAERTTLISCHNQCSDWSKIRLWVAAEAAVATELAVALQQQQAQQQQAQPWQHYDMSPWLQKHITFNRLDGFVTIRVDWNHTNAESQQQHQQQHQQQQSSSDSVPMLPPPGIHHNTLITNCILDHHCRVYRNTILQNTYIGGNATVMNNGRITASNTSSTENRFGELSISVGPESGGGRHLNVSVESTMIDVCQQMGMSRRIHTSTTTTPSKTGTTPFLLNHDFNIIGDECLVRDTPTIHHIYMACHSSIEAATCVENTTLLSTAMIGHASTVQYALLQWHASILHQSHVTHALLMEHAHIGPHSIVAHTILGPDVHVSAGEVHASVLGPNTNAHHQSLLISALWPLGRGNVGYGANVGSNHTGRIPDQEIIVPEGMFWGLSTVIKFPVNLSSSPYSLIAAGTTLSPQQKDDVAMPFSLIVNDSSTGGASTTSIIPGWVLQHSPYTIRRSEQKFAYRRKAKRHDFYTGWKIIRPSIIQLCWMARQELIQLQQDENENGTATKSKMMMIGNMVLSEKARSTGIVAYANTIRRYALLGLLEQLQQNQNQQEAWLENEFHTSTSLPTSTETTPIPIELDSTQPQWSMLPWEETENVWTLQKAILVHEFPMKHDHYHHNNDMTMTCTSKSRFGWIMNLLQGELISLEQEYAQRVFKCKQRDDTRGRDTIPGYTTSHVLASDDAVVQAVQQHAMKVQHEIEAICQALLLAVQSNQEHGTTNIISSTTSPKITFSSKL